MGHCVFIHWYVKISVSLLSCCKAIHSLHSSTYKKCSFLTRTMSSDSFTLYFDLKVQFINRRFNNNNSVAISPHMILLRKWYYAKQLAVAHHPSILSFPAHPWGSRGAPKPDKLCYLSSELWVNPRGSYQPPMGGIQAASESTWWSRNSKMWLYFVEKMLSRTLPRETPVTNAFRALQNTAARCTL